MKLYGLLLISTIALACKSPRAVSPVSKKETPVDIFWNNLQNLCGHSFQGTITFAAATDTAFREKDLIMHVKSCAPDMIRIPFVVGNDRSRTWVLTKNNDRVLLKHDHRHEAGWEDDITQYGGWSTHIGNDTMQVFPADQFTIDLLPAAVGNVWWIEIVSGVHFTYNLRRVHTDRRFSVRFDLSRPVETPETPWGWKD